MRKKLTMTEFLKQKFFSVVDTVTLDANELKNYLGYVGGIEKELVSVKNTNRAITKELGLFMEDNECLLAENKALKSRLSGLNEVDIKMSRANAQIKDLMYKLDLANSLRDSAKARAIAAEVSRPCTESVRVALYNERGEIYA